MQERQVLNTLNAVEGDIDCPCPTLFTVIKTSKNVGKGYSLEQKHKI